MANKNLLKMAKEHADNRIEYPHPIAKEEESFEMKVNVSEYLMDEGGWYCDSHIKAVVDIDQYSTIDETIKKAIEKAANKPMWRDRAESLKTTVSADYYVHMGKDIHSQNKRVYPNDKISLYLESHPKVKILRLCIMPRD